MQRCWDVIDAQVGYLSWYSEADPADATLQERHWRSGKIPSWYSEAESADAL